MSKFAVLAAGGTGGHMFPAQALAEELLRRSWRLALASDTRGLLYANGMPEAMERRALKAATPSRGGLIGKIAAPLALWSGTLEALKWFKSDRPDIVIGFGGYPAAPATAAAIRLKLPRIIHEQNAVLGRANKLFAKRADVLACGICEPVNAPSGCTIQVLGNPIRDSALKAAETPYPELTLDGPIHLLVFGGSQGAGKFSEIVPPALSLLPDEMRARLRVTQQVREEHLEEARTRFHAAEINAEISPFFDDMPARIAAAHLVIARAGASTIAELTAIGRPSILIPLPTAIGDHQTENARTLAEKGAAVLMPEAELSADSLAENLSELLGASDGLAKMAGAARALGRPIAAVDLADLVEKLANAKAR